MPGRCFGLPLYNVKACEALAERSGLLLLAASFISIQQSDAISGADFKGPALRTIMLRFGPAIRAGPFFSTNRIESSRENVGLATIAAGHCTGWRGMAALVAAFGDKTIAPSAVDKRYTF
jgi:hypothetical protein